MRLPTRILRSYVSNKAIHLQTSSEATFNMPATPPADTPSPCQTCHPTALHPIYAIGSVRAEFRSNSIQREFQFERSSMELGTRTEREMFYDVLSRRRDLARSICWILTVESIPVYHIIPRTDRDLDDFVNALKPEESGDWSDTTVVVGTKGPVRECAGFALPVVFTETLYAFPEQALMESMISNIVPAQTGVTSEQSISIAKEVFERIRQISDNMGETPEHRAINYIAVRFTPLYETVMRLKARNYSLASIDVRQSRLYTDLHRVYDVIVTFEPNFAAAIEQYFVRVDVTDIYPHVHSTAMQPFFER